MRGASGARHDDALRERDHLTGNRARVIAAQVRDSGGNLLSGVNVIFTAPTTGASGTFGGLTSVSAATVTLGKSEAILPRGEQIPGETHHVGERVKAVILEVRKVGHRVKIILFMTTAASAALLACIQVLSVGSADVLRGQNKEFEAIITAVVGGTLLTGGYGSALGSAFGAFILGTTQLGINFVGINSDWYQVVMGAILLLAVLANTYLLRRASGARS